MAMRIVCDRCGQEQEFSSAELLEDPDHPSGPKDFDRGGIQQLGWVLPAEPATCINCGSGESAMMLDTWVEETQA
jgi:hypothetical protein